MSLSLPSERSIFRRLLIEGYTPEEILALPNDKIDAILFVGRPLILRVGSARILGEFHLEGGCLIVELAQIDGGGEGVLPMLWNLAHHYANHRGWGTVEWFVHAVNCAKPNMKLREMLVRRGFEVRFIKGKGETFWKRVSVKG